MEKDRRVSQRRVNKKDRRKTSNLSELRIFGSRSLGPTVLDRRIADRRS